MLGRGRVGVALPADHGDDAAPTGSRHSDDVGDFGAGRVVNRPGRLQHGPPGRGGAVERGPSVEAVAGGGVDVAADPDHPVNSATVQLAATDESPPIRAPGQAIDPHPVLVFAGIVGLTRAGPHRPVNRVSGQRANGQAGKSAADGTPVGAVVGGAPDTAAGGAGVDEAAG